MIRYSKIVEIAYLALAIFFIVEAVSNWDTERTSSYIYLAFSALAVFMHFFRKKFRRKFENQKNE